MRHYSKKIIVVLSFIGLLVLVFGCKKSDDTAVDKSPDIEAFLAETRPQYKFRNDTGVFTWKFQFSQYQMLWFSQGVDGDQNNPVRNVGFRLSSENNSNYFKLSLPTYDTSSQSEFDALFELGPKKLGSEYADIHLEIQEDNVVYTVCDIENNINIELIKVEEVTEESPPQTYLNAYYKISGFDFNECGADSYEVDYILILAQFINYKQ